MVAARSLDWLEIRIHTSEEAIEAVSYYLIECGLDGVVIEDPQVYERNRRLKYGAIDARSSHDAPKQGAILKGYVSPEEDLESIVKRIRAHLDSLPAFGLDPGPKVVTTRRLKKEEWMERWKQTLRSVPVSDRILVKPVWEKISSPSEIVIELDPGLAFGTGHHTTTIQALRFLEEYLKEGDQVIDVGCGSGILSIAAAKLGAEQVLAIDLDPQAVKETHKHVQLNQLKDQIEIQCGDGLKQVSRRVDFVVANILAEIIIPLIDDLPRVLVPGGIFIAAGIIKEKKSDVVTLLQEYGFRLLDQNEKGEWVAIVAEKW